MEKSNVETMIAGLDVGVVVVEEEDEHAGPRILEHRARLGDARRLAPQFLRQAPGHHHVFEGIDGLRRAILDDLEIVLL